VPALELIVPAKWCSFAGMLAIDVKEPGGPEVLRLAEVPDPVPGPDELLVRVRATAVNRADTLQRRGKYPPPAGASPIIGLELAGEVVHAAHGFAAGERVMALLPGGGYAQLAAIPAGMAMRIPDGLTFEQAAAFPEVWMTAFDNLFNWGRLAAGEWALVHGGGSGVGTAAIQLARSRGAKVVVTCGSAEKVERCLALGAEAGIDYKREDFVERTLAITGGRGADVVLDVQGGGYLDRNLRAIAVGGRLVIIATMGGAKAELDIGRLMMRRASVTGTTLRARPLAEKIALTRQVEREVVPPLARGDVRVVIDRIYDLADAPAAHALMETSAHFGKIVLRVP
jgi:putative PIG3 family NAD(P)H quinone oxidoreductase